MTPCALAVTEATVTSLNFAHRRLVVEEESRRSAENRGEKRLMRVRSDGSSAMSPVDGGVAVPLQEQEPVGGVEDAVVAEERDLAAHDGARGAVEEADVGLVLVVAREEAVALGEHHPPARVEAGVGHAAAGRGGRAGSPVGADGAEADVVQQVAGLQQPVPDQPDQIRLQRRPRRW